jgi:cardiolipin synthase
MNLDNRSLALNDEATLMVLDRELGRELETIFFEDLRHAEEITLEDFRRRPWLERFAEQSAKLFTRLL